MIFGESVLGKLAMSFVMAMAPVADVLDIRMKTALPAITVGVVIAGCITTAVTCGVVSLF